MDSLSPELPGIILDYARLDNDGENSFGGLVGSLTVNQQFFTTAVPILYADLCEYSGLLAHLRDTSTDIDADRLGRVYGRHVVEANTGYIDPTFIANDDFFEWSGTQGIRLENIHKLNLAEHDDQHAVFKVINGSNVKQLYLYRDAYPPTNPDLERNASQFAQLLDNCPNLDFVRLQNYSTVLEKIDPEAALFSQFPEIQGMQIPPRTHSADLFRNLQFFQRLKSINIRTNSIHMDDASTLVANRLEHLSIEDDGDPDSGEGLATLIGQMANLKSVKLITKGSLNNKKLLDGVSSPQLAKLQLDLKQDQFSPEQTPRLPVLDAINNLAQRCRKIDHLEVRMTYLSGPQSDYTCVDLALFPNLRYLALSQVMVLGKMLLVTEPESPQARLAARNCWFWAGLNCRELETFLAPSSGTYKLHQHSFIHGAEIIDKELVLYPRVKQVPLVIIGIEPSGPCLFDAMNKHFPVQTSNTSLWECAHCQSHLVPETTSD